MPPILLSSHIVITRYGCFTLTSLAQAERILVYVRQYKKIKKKKRRKKKRKKERLKSLKNITKICLKILTN
jgi:hypothetical protein